MQGEVKLVGADDVGAGVVRTVRRLRAADEGARRAGSTDQRPIAIGALPPAAAETVTPDGDLRLVSLSEAARFLCVSRGTLYDLLRSGRLASVHIGRLRRVPVGELRRFVEARLESERRA
jgi:excisionase family DNA binding protein